MVEDQATCEGLISQKYSTSDVCAGIYKNPRYRSIHPLLPEAPFIVHKKFKDADIATGTCLKSMPVAPDKIIQVATSNSSCRITRSLQQLNATNSPQGSAVPLNSSGYYNEAFPGSGTTHIYPPNECKYRVFDVVFGVTATPAVLQPSLALHCKGELQALKTQTPLALAPNVENGKRRLTLTTVGETYTNSYACDFIFSKGQWLTKDEFDAQGIIDGRFGGEVEMCNLTSDQQIPLLPATPLERLSGGKSFLMGGNQNRLIQLGDAPFTLSDDEVHELCQRPVGTGPNSPRLMDVLTPNAKGEIVISSGSTSTLGCPKINPTGDLDLQVLGTCPIEKCQLVTGKGEVLSEMGSGNTNLLLRFIRPTTMAQCKSELEKDLDSQCHKLASAGKIAPDALFAKWGRAETLIGSCDPTLFKEVAYPCEIKASRPGLISSFIEEPKTLVSFGLEPGFVSQSGEGFDLIASAPSSVPAEACADRLSGALESADFCGYARNETGFSDEETFLIRAKNGDQESLSRTCLGKPSIAWPETDLEIPDPANPGSITKNPDPGLEALVTPPADFTGFAFALEKAFRVIRFGCAGPECQNFGITREWTPYALTMTSDEAATSPSTHYQHYPRSLVDQLFLMLGHGVMNPEYYQPEALGQKQFLTPKKIQALSFPEGKFGTGIRVRYESIDTTVQTQWVEAHIPEKASPPAAPEPTPTPVATPTNTPPPPTDSPQSGIDPSSALQALESAGRSADQTASFGEWLTIAPEIFGMDPVLAKEKLVSIYGDKVMTPKTLREWIQLTLDAGVPLDSKNTPSRIDPTSSLETLKSAGRDANQTATFEEWLKLASEIFGLDPSLGKEKLVSKYDDKALTAKTLREWIQLSLDAGVPLDSKAGPNRTSAKQLEVQSEIQSVIPEEGL
jgi:hypothetical protein